MAAPDEASTYQSLTLDGASATNVESVYMVPLPRNTENRMTQEAEASETCDHKKSPGSSSQYFWLRTAVAVVVFAIAIAVILVASLSFAGYNNMQLTKATAESQEELKMKGDTISDLYQRIENLTEILQQMQMMVEHQNEETTRMLNSTRDQVNVLDILSTNLDQTRANVADLEMGVSSVNYTLRDYITEQIAETQSDISTHTSQISAITTDVSNLMNSQVSLSQSCHVERRGMGYDSPSTFFVEIETGSLPVNRTNYYTLDMRCELSDTLDGSAVVSNFLKFTGSEVRCSCTATGQPNSINGDLGLFSGGSYCDLVITRCLSTLTRN